MSIDINEPLIWTSKGNLPLSSLAYKTSWEDTPTYTAFVEEHTLDGEVVKRSVHVMAKQGFELAGAAG
jgi:hypothetical protein